MTKRETCENGEPLVDELFRVVIGASVCNNLNVLEFIVRDEICDHCPYWKEKEK